MNLIDTFEKKERVAFHNEVQGDVPEVAWETIDINCTGL